MLRTDNVTTAGLSDRTATDARRSSSGALVILVGPDGVGKTTIARELAAVYQGPTVYFHFVPPIRETMSSTPPEISAPHLGKGKPSGSRVLGWLRLFRNAGRFWLGYLLRVRPAIAKGSLVIGDRGMYGYLVQPNALKFFGPAGLAKAVLRALPTPDLVVNLSAPPDVIRKRKQELSREAIVRELAAWRMLPTRRLRTFDAEQTPTAIGLQIVEEI